MWALLALVHLTLLYYRYHHRLCAPSSLSLKQLAPRGTTCLQTIKIAVNPEVHWSSDLVRTITVFLPGSHHTVRSLADHFEAEGLWDRLLKLESKLDSEHSTRKHAEKELRTTKDDSTLAQRNETSSAQTVGICFARISS